MDETLIERFAALVGQGHALTDPTETAPFLVEQRGLYRGNAPLVLRPGTSEEVSKILALANETGTPIVPQGGNTGLVGGQIPHTNGNEVVVSLGRLNRIRAVDAPGNTMTAEAGVVLETIHEAADAAGRLFPLSLGSQGSCQIGGNLSSNAGGTGVLAYGNARELVLGLEVVLADGSVWDGLRSLRKDNTGYDLKQLFIGAEGTLGIITAAVLKLFARPHSQEVVFCAVPDPHAALKLLELAQGSAGSWLTGFELMPRIAVEMSVAHTPGVRDPLAKPYPWYVLMEISIGNPGIDARAATETIFTRGHEAGLILDAALAESVAQAREMWHLRHAMSDAQKPEGGSIKHDVSVPVARVPEFLDRAIAAVTGRIPGCRPVPFGHMGDGNIHFNISQPVGADRQAYLDRWEEVNALVHGIVADLGGSISAEHGIGMLKRELLTGVKSEVELGLMRKIKATLDPNNILNPGKIL